MKKKTVKSTQSQEAQPLDTIRESLILGHLIKYNLYLLAKSIIFASIVKQTGDVDKSAEQTNRIIHELDLDTKKKTEQA